VRPAGLRNPLGEFSRTVQGLIRDVSPAVVGVVVQSFGRQDDESSGRANAVSHQTREGTGVLVSADGYLITNEHVVLTAQRVQIRFGETASRTQGDTGRLGPLQAEIIGIDQETDVAVLKIPGNHWKYLRFADSSQLRQGEVVFAVGNPRGLENSVSMGIVSAVKGSWIRTRVRLRCSSGRVVLPRNLRRGNVPKRPVFCQKVALFATC